MSAEIRAAVLEYEHLHGGPADTAGIATRVFNTIENCGGLVNLRSMTLRDLQRVKNVGPRTVKALIDLGLIRLSAAKKE